MRIIQHSSEFVNGDENIESVLEEIGKLWQRKQKTDIDVCFQIGDLFNRYCFHSGPRYERIVARFGLNLYQQFRLYGWIASKWLPKDRVKNKPLRYFRDNSPDGPEPTKKKRNQEVFNASDSDAEVIDGDLYIIGTNESGKRSVQVHMTTNQLEEYLRIVSLAQKL